jgi:Flp pilus assembly protein TadD/TolB-like protein
VIRAWKFARRHAAITSIAALCLMLAITGATLNHFRQRTAQRLSEATAYDRTVGVLPAEDVETMRIDSVLARQATEFLRMSLRAVPGLPIRESSLSPESVPAGSKLVPYSQELGARYLVTATIRLRGERKRLVVQVIDAIEDQTAVPLVLETTPGAVWPDPQPLLARVREFCVSRGTRNGVAEASKPEGEDEIVEKYVQTGNDLIARGSRGDLDLAIAAFGKALQQKPEHSGALAGLAAALNFRGLHGQRARWDAGALAVAERALLSAPLQASSHRSLSRIFLRRGEIAQAREHGFQAFELDPRDPQAASAIAAAEFEVDAIDRALAWIQRAESRNPSAGAYALHRGDFLAAIGAHDLAERAYLELAEFRPQLPDAPLGLAHIALLKGDAGGSLRTIRELRTRFPNDTRVAQTHAALEFHVGDPLTAEKIYREFADDPDGGLIAYLGVRAASALGYLALQHGEDGRAWIETALRFDREQSQAEPDESVLHYEEGANLALLGRADEALAKLRSAAACSATVSPMLRLDRRLDLLRHDERFNAIIEECEARLAAMRARVQSAHHPQP